MTMDLRSLTLGSKNYKFKVVEFDLPIYELKPLLDEHGVQVTEEREDENGKPYTVDVMVQEQVGAKRCYMGLKQPSVKRRNSFAAEFTGAKDEDQRWKASIKLLIDVACKPSGERLYSPADFDVLYASEGQEWLESVTKKAIMVATSTVVTPTCKATVQRDGKDVECGCELVPNEPHCPRCKADVPGPIEQVKGS